MIEKIKVNLSYYAYKTLLNDMVRFECFKPNGEVNKNNFLNVVIFNLYQNKLKKRDDFKDKLEKEALLTDLSAKNKTKMFEACSLLMDNYYNEDLNYRYHQYYFTIYPTTKTQDFFNSIYENEIKNTSAFSAFIRKLLNEYVYLPQYVRENVAKRSEAIELGEACNNNNVVIFRTSNTEHRIAPFKLIPNEEETYSYLLGIDLNAKEFKPISIRLSKIYNVTPTKEKHIFTKEEKMEFYKVAFHGVEFASSEIVKVQIEVTKAGIKMLNFKLHNQPPIRQISENILEVSSSISNFYTYFIQFGKEVKILNNDDLKSKFEKFYKEAYELYKN